MATPSRQDINRDLGFGAVVSSESRRRLLNRDGSFNVARHGLPFWSSLSLYHSLLTISWPRFLLAVSLGYFGVNVVFAGAYLLCGVDAIAGSDSILAEHSFLRAFFFSVQTLSTVGYGRLLPASLAAHAVMTAESLVGLFCIALATGLVFARFSRPTARIEYSRHAIVAPYRDITGFMFRIVNLRKSQLIELEAKLLMARLCYENGRWVRKYDFLPLERQSVTFFPLSWTIVHPIGEDSPLRGLKEDDLKEQRAEFLVLLSGIDEVHSQTVHSRSSYRADEVVWNVRFARMFDHEPTSDTVGVDIGRLNEIVPVE